MTRSSSLVRFGCLRRSCASLLTVALCLLGSRAAWAKFVAPPLPGPDAHCVSMVGWLSPADIRKIDEEADIAQTQTGYVIDILLAPSDDPIDEVASETFQAWKPGDPGKDNGILIVLQPNFPRGDRKVRMQVGTAVQGKISATKARDILRNTIGPLINDTDQIRTGIAAGVAEITATLTAGGSSALSDAGLVAVDGGMVPSPGAAAAAPSSAPAKEAAPRESTGSELKIAAVFLVAAILGVLGARRLSRRG